jgi:hypothetical protein
MSSENRSEPLSARILGVGIGFTATVVTLAFFYGLLWKVSPWWFWTSDMCRSPNVVCGTLPFGPIIAVVGTVLFVFWLRSKPRW